MVSVVKRGALSACLISSLVGRAVLAAEPASEPTLTYSLSWVRADGAESCPSGRALASEVERRLGRKVFDASAERSFEITVSRIGERFKSDMYVRDAAGRALGHRTLEGDEPGCGPLLAATALAVALVIDPDAAARVPAASADFEAAPPVVSPAPTLPPPVPATPEPKTVTRVERVLVRTPRPLLTFSLRGGSSRGLVPKAGRTVELAFDVQSTSRWGFAAAAAYVGPRNAEVGIGSLDVGLTRARALVTFDALRSRSARLLFGGGVALGAFHLAVRRPTPVTAPGDYLYLGLELAAELQLPVTKDIFVSAAGVLAAPLRRQEFLVRAQDEPVWRQPLVAGEGVVGVGMMFP